jgi:predicted dehydrogenase
MDKPVKIALVGAGYMAREHLRAFQGLPSVELAGVFSRTEDKARELAKEFGVSRVCHSVEQLYRETRANLVVVTVRELAMAEVAKQCFQFPWVCLLEKPAGYDLQDAESILSAAKGANATVYVALNRRCYASTRQALSMLTHEAGRRLVIVHDQQDQAAAAESGQPPEIVRNYMFANSIHLIDYLRVFGRGEPTAVRIISPWTPADPGFVVAGVEFDSGDVGVYHGTWSGPGPWAVSVTDTTLRLEMRPLESLTVQPRGERRAAPVDLGTIDVDFKPGLRAQAIQAVAAVRDRANPGLATLEDSTHSMRLAARIFDIG